MDYPVVPLIAVPKTIIQITHSEYDKWRRNPYSKTPGANHVKYEDALYHQIKRPTKPPKSYSDDSDPHIAAKGCFYQQQSGDGGQSCICHDSK